MLKPTTENVFSSSEEKIWRCLPNPCSPPLRTPPATLHRVGLLWHISVVQPLLHCQNWLGQWGTPNPGWANQIFFSQNPNSGFWDAGQIHLNFGARLGHEVGLRQKQRRLVCRKGKTEWSRCADESGNKRPRGSREVKKLTWFWQLYSSWPKFA